VKRILCFYFVFFSDSSSAIPRRRRRTENPYEVGVISVRGLDTGLHQKSALEPALLSQSNVSPKPSPRSEELAHRSSPFKTASKVASDCISHFIRPVPSPAPDATSSSRSSGDEHRQSYPSRPTMRLASDSGTHFLQARRGANSEMATSKEQVSVRFETRKTSLPPVVFPGKSKSGEREETPPPSKLRPNAALR
jgi:hypothetical protein